MPNKTKGVKRSRKGVIAYLKAHVLTDAANRVRAIRHTQEYWENLTGGGLPTAVAYLREFGRIGGMKALWAIRCINRPTPHLEIERPDTGDDRNHAIRELTHPEHRVELADKTRETLAHLDHAALNGKVRSPGFHGFDPRGCVAPEPVPYTRDLVVPRGKEPRHLLTTVLPADLD